MKEDFGRIIDGTNKFGKKDKKIDVKKEPDKSKEIRETYSGIGVAPKMKIAMLAKATEIEEWIKKIKDIKPIPDSLLETMKEEWEGKNEYALLREAERSTEEQWSQSPRTYLALAEALRKKAMETAPEPDSIA